MLCIPFVPLKFTTLPNASLKEHSTQRGRLHVVASSHQVMGFTWGMIAITIYNSFGIIPGQLLSTLFFFVAVIIGSLIPDIDTPNSKLGGPFEKWGLVLMFSLIGVEIITPGVTKVIQYILMMLSPLLFVFTGHRKFTHSIAFVLLMAGYSTILYLFIHIPIFYLMGFLVGVISHLFGDYLTKRGIPLLYPLSRKYFRFFVTFKTGSPTEKGITTGLIIVNIIILTKTTL